QRGEVRPGPDAHPVAGALQAYPAVDVVQRERAEHRQRGRGEADVEQVAPERQIEDVEADVRAELRIGDPEVDAVTEEHPLLPMGLAGEPGEQANDGRGGADPEP